MLGKILLYRVEEGTGLLLTPDNQKYPFDVEAWSDFDKMPQTGLRVDFEMMNNKVVAIKTSSSSNVQTSDNKEVQFCEEALAQEDPAAKAFEAIDLETLSVQSVSAGTMEKTIEHFFEDLTNTVHKYNHHSSDEENKQLDYFKIRRFIYTAYNTLREIDAQIVDRALVSILENLREIENVHNVYKRSKSQPRVAFQNIFLKYTRYKEAKLRLEHNISEMNQLNKKIDELDKAIEFKQHKLLNTGKKEMNLPEEISMLKKMKRLHVDTIDRIGVLREENEKLVPITHEYYDKFFEDFLGKFNRSYDENMRILKRIIDSLAFSFDRSMWDKARKSMSINAFFKNSDIADAFGTLAFLKYYMRSLDPSKLSVENQELLKIKNYLEKKQRSSCG